MNRSDSQPQPPAPSEHSPSVGRENRSGEPDDGEPSGESAADAAGWTTGDQWFALTAGGAILLLLLAHWGRLTLTGAPVVEIRQLDPAVNRFQLDINEATWVEWMQLEGVGETLSRRIVEDRRRNGPFTSIDDIQRVRGIGPVTLEQLRPWLRCDDCPASPDGAGRNE